MSREKQGVRIDGHVIEALPGLLFRVKLENGNEILAHLAGKMKMHYIRVIPGDRVTVELPNLTDKRGRIVRRF